MQKKTVKTEEYSIDDLDNLIESIKKRTFLNEEQIATNLGYNEGYISQVRSRGKVSGKFIRALKRAHPETLQNANFSRETDANNQSNETSTENPEKKNSLEKSIENLTETGKIQAQNERMRIENEKVTVESIQKLIALLEQQYGKKIGPTLPPSGTPGTKTRNPRKQKKSAHS